MSKYIALGAYVASASGLIAIILGLVNFSFLNRSSKIIFYFLIFSLSTNIIHFTITRFFHRTDLFIPHVYAIFEFAFVSFFYYNILSGFIKKAIPYLIIIFTIACLADFIVQNYQIKYNSYTRSVDALIIIFYAMMFFLQQSATEHNHSFTDLSENWINIGLLIFYSCNFFVLAFSNYLLNKSMKSTGIAWFTYEIFLIAENILFAIAFYKWKKPPTTFLYS